MRRRAMAMLAGATLLMATAIPASAQSNVEYYIFYYVNQASLVTTQSDCKALDKEFKEGTGLSREDRRAIKTYSIEWLKPSGPCRLVGPDGPIEPTP